jgi:magnesium transporter
MPLVRDLADRILREHPQRAALLLEQHPAASAVESLARLEARDAAEVVRFLSPTRAAEVVAALPPGRASALLAALALDHAARLSRRLTPEARAAAFAGLEERRARSLEALLTYPEGSAGALMDPDVLALPAELSVEAALSRVRTEPGNARYNLYVIDAEQRLVGALNLRELMLAAHESTLAELMVANPLRLPAGADIASVVAHPGWKEVHSLPVVDDAGRYLGAVRYRTLRELEEELRRRQQVDTVTSHALGELLALGAAGAMQALAGPGAPRRGGADER